MNETVHIYAVGLLRDLREIRNEVRRIARAKEGGKRRQQRIQSLRYRLRRIVRDLPRDSYWNGYLAEPTSEGIYWTRCGHGWTKRRAEASLLRHIGEVQRDGYLRYVPEVAA